MWQRFTLYDIRVIGHYLGVLILFFSLALLLPLVTALVCQEWQPATRYVTTIGISLIVGSGLRFLRIEPGKLNRQQALAVTGLAWIVLAFVATVPLFLSGHYDRPIDAFFDGVSGLTTTGATLVQDLDHLSYADNMWRFVMHFVGGLGLIVVALSFGLFGRRSSASLYSSEGRSEHVVPNVIQSTQMIAKVALGCIFVATVILMAMCLALGIEPLRAFLHSFWLAISGFMTAGFAPMHESVLYYQSFGIEVVLMVLMIIGTVSFILYAVLLKGHTDTFFRDLEIRTMVVWLVVIAAIFAAALTGSTAFSDLGAMLRRGLFMLIAAFSTTGFQNITSNQLVTVMTSGAFLVLALIMAVGGSAGSTAGGIKLRRVGIIAKSLVVTIKEALSPDSARVVVTFNHLGRRLITPGVVKEAMTVFILFIITYAIGSLAGIAHGYEATASIFESVAMTSNGGLSAGIASPGMPVSLEAIYIFQMWAGRLEFVTLIALVVKVVVSAIPRRGPSDGSKKGAGKTSKETNEAPKNARTMTKSGGKTAKSASKPPKVSGVLLTTAALVVAVASVPTVAVASVDGDPDNLINPQQLPDSSFIYDTGITELDSADSYYDGQTVQVSGEVVGDCIRDETQDGYCWVTLTTYADSSNSSIAVHMKRDDAAKIDAYGKYGQTGTRLQVRGTFDLACADHAGAADLHAEYVSVAEKGIAHYDELVYEDFLLGITLCFVGLVMMFVYYRMRERRR